MNLELEEIQGLVLSGYPDKPAATFYVFSIVDPRRARRWLHRLLRNGLVQFADFLHNGRNQPPYLCERPVNVAFTFEGFRLLDLPEEALAGFSGSFREGMAAPHRSRQLGDDGKSAPEHWRWGGPNGDAVHGLLCVYGELDADLSAPIGSDDGVVVVRTLPTLPTPQKRADRIEHFGYRDGISNPTVEGAPQRRKNRDVIPPGELLLGYPNAYGKVPASPRVSAELDLQEQLPRAEEDRSKRDFGRNGSYVVLRQLEQDVAAFKEFTKNAAEALGVDPDWVGSRMVGRWKDGTPVTLRPERNGKPANDTPYFTFHANEDDVGQRCPMGSHIRRTNPRDTILPVPHDPALCGVDENTTTNPIRPIPNQHRIVRRGRSYGPPIEEAPNEERGLQFLCFNASLRRQFEFVQSQWVNNPCFAGLTRDPDPLLATSREHPFPANDLTLQGRSGHPARTLRDVPRLTEVRGGAYFFMPSRRALEYLAALPVASIERIVPNERADAEADAALHCSKITRDFEAQPAPRRARRGFHVKAHGVCAARLTVRADLPRSFAHGVFSAGASYEAWVRFSSSAFAIAKDTSRDVHGIAIKLVGVVGERAADFEEQTQDFLLVDAPYLMVPNIAAALAFDRAQIAGSAKFAWHLLTHPWELAKVARMTSAPRHPLERVYSSVAPFQLGPHVVRWGLRPAPGGRLVEVPRSPDRLRTALAEQLRKDGSMRLELCVEMRGGRARRPIEEGDVDWGGSLERIADLEILADGFGTPEQEELGERMSFNPWNALAAHRPLGNLNRARKLVYRAVYLHRTTLNGEKPFEPRPVDERPDEATSVAAQ